jgi:hypothetical protein
MVMTRSAVVAAPVILAVMGWLVTHYLDGRFEQQSLQLSAVSVRVSGVEGSAQIAADKAENVANNLTATATSLRDEQAQAAAFRIETSNKLDKASETLTTLSNSLIALTTEIADWHRREQPPPN